MYSWLAVLVGGRGKRKTADGFMNPKAADTKRHQLFDEVMGRTHRWREHLRGIRTIEYAHALLFFLLLFRVITYCRVRLVHLQAP